MICGSENHVTHRRRSDDARGRRRTRSPRNTRRASNTASARGRRAKDLCSSRIRQGQRLLGDPAIIIPDRQGDRERAARTIPVDDGRIDSERRSPSLALRWIRTHAVVPECLLDARSVSELPRRGEIVAPGIVKGRAECDPAPDEERARSDKVQVHVVGCRALKLWKIRFSWPSGKTTTIHAGLSPPSCPFTRSLNGVYASVAVTCSRRENVMTSVVAACFDGLPGFRMRSSDATTPESESTVKERSCHFSPAISIRYAACATPSSSSISGGRFAIVTTAAAEATSVPSETSMPATPDKSSV